MSDLVTAPGETPDVVKESEHVIEPVRRAPILITLHEVAFEHGGRCVGVAHEAHSRGDRRVARDVPEFTSGYASCAAPPSIAARQHSQPGRHRTRNEKAVTAFLASGNADSFLRALPSLRNWAMSRWAAHLRLLSMVVPGRSQA
jgi:hypothetical protein